MVSQSLWKNRNFMLMWGGQFASWLGTEVSGITLPLVVLSITGSPAQAGSIAAMRGIIYVFLAIPAGVYVDRSNRRKIMVVANLGSGLAMGSIALAIWLEFLTIPFLYVAGAIEGAFFVFANLARFTTTPLLVPNEQLPAASAQINVADFTALAIGPALGGILYQTIGAAFSFLLDSLSYFINMISIFFITAPLNAPVKAKETSIKEDIHEGFKWFWNQPTIRFMNLVTSSITLVIVGLTLLIIVIAKQYHAPSVTIGMILGIGAAGGILGSVVAPWFHKRFRFRQIIIGSTIAFAFVFGLYLFAYNILLLAVFTGLLNLIAPIYEVTAFSYSASIIPNEIRGKISSFTRLTVLGAYSLGYFLMGVSIQFLGITRTILVFFLFLFLIAFFVFRNKSIRNI